MTDKEMNEMSLFVSNDGVYIAKMLKGGKPSKVRKKLSDEEIMNLMLWYTDQQCLKLQSTDFTVNLNGKPAYHFENILWAEASQQAKAQLDKEIENKAE